MWTNPLAKNLQWSDEISNKEEKQAVADKLADMVKDGQVIGAGSGSTSFLALQTIARKAKEENLSISIAATSREIELSATVMGLKTSSLLSVKPDWYFDGADEVDPDGNLIKGRGGAMMREKLVMLSASETYILVDQSKFVDNLGGKFAVPVEVQQEALHYVETSLGSLGANDIKMRPAVNKDGPVITESGHFILDCQFSDIGAGLEKEIKSVTGVIESGLFWGYSPKILTN